MKNILKVENINVKYKEKEAINNINLSIQMGKVYSIIGPNGSGKTTLLRTISRNLKPYSGRVLLDNENIFKIGSKNVAQKMAVLSQVHNNTSDITVKTLTTYGRYAHREWWKAKSKDDDAIVNWAIRRTNLKELENRKLSTLSGGERQRAWIAMAIAQKPKILLLDEPTTFLDISHQLEVLELVSSLNKEESLTIVMVLHDINHAARYSDELVVIKDGKIYAEGNPWDILSGNVVKDVFSVKSQITCDEDTGKPIFYAKEVV